MINKKLHLGAGTRIKQGWINHDLVNLQGIDVVHDLTQFPWPWEDNSIDEVYAKDVLEHLPNIILTMEEIHRVCKSGGKVYIAVPYWNSWEAITDPTHVSKFNEFTFEFFDSQKVRCQLRPYYSSARFRIKKIGFGVCLPPPLRPSIVINGRSRQPLSRIFPWKYTIFFNPIAKWILSVFASYFSNIIIGLEIYLEKE